MAIGGLSKSVYSSTLVMDDSYGGVKASYAEIIKRRYVSPPFFVIPATRINEKI